MVDTTEEVDLPSLPRLLKNLLRLVTQLIGKIRIDLYSSYGYG